MMQKGPFYVAAPAFSESLEGFDTFIEAVAAANKLSLALRDYRVAVYGEIWSLAGDDPRPIEEK